MHTMNGLSKKKVERIAQTYLDKITEVYGFSKHFKSYPYLTLEDKVYSDGTDKNLKGEFISDDNDIVLYWKNIKSEEELIRTLVHEYTHYLQSPSWMTRYYNMGYEYTDHPYEVQAYVEEENWIQFNKK
jgi:hypothetical protein